jgi:hypothetical protein
MTFKINENNYFILVSTKFYLVFKYGRKDREQKTITEKIAKLSFHSVVKKSNRIGMKLSNVFKISEISVRNFNYLFSYIN